MRRKWTEAEDRRLTRMYVKLAAVECAERLGRTVSAVQQRVNVLGLRKSAEWISARAAQRWAEGRHEGSRKAQFRKGQQAWNKGRPASEWNPNADSCRATQFKKGEMRGAAQHNYVPVGTEKIRDGLLCRKVTDDPNLYPAARWQPVARIVWEAVNGPIPAGHVVRFRKGMATMVREEITTDRIECVSRAENMRRNSYHNYPQPIPQLIQLRGALQRQINKREKV